MKKTLKTMLLAAAVVVGLAGSALLTSCDNNDGWYPEHPDYMDNFYDPAVTGTWKLVSFNGTPVTGELVNYLQFEGDGIGNYYYYQDGNEMVTPLTYVCHGSDSEFTQTEMDLNYGGNSFDSTLYWFDGSHMVMQWVNSGGNVTTEVYSPVNSAPW